MKVSKLWRHDDWWPDADEHWSLPLWGFENTHDTIGFIEGGEGHYEWQVMATYSGSTKTLRAAKLAVQRAGARFLREGLDALEDGNFD